MNGNDVSDVDTNNTMVRQRCRIVDAIDDDDDDDDDGGGDDCELIDCGCCTVLVAVTGCGGDDNAVVKS